MNHFQKKSKSGRHFVIRYPTMDDVVAMTEYINTLSDEHTYVAWQGEHISVEEETEFLESMIKKFSGGKAVMLLALSEEKIIGIANVTMQSKATSHEGMLGLSIAKDFRNDGIGSQLLDTVIVEAIRYLPELKIISLGVFANNPRAISLYESRGFLHAGVVPKGIRHGNAYIDHIFMYKFVGDFVI